MKDNRRDFLKKSTSLAAALSLGAVGASAAMPKSDSKTAYTLPKGKKWSELIEGPDTPKMTMSVSPTSDLSTLKSIKQFGCDYVHMTGPRLPWTKEMIKGIVDRYKEQGLTVINIMVTFSGAIIHGTEGRDEEIKQVQDALRAAGAAGVPVVEYNFYSHRAVEGYYDVAGRGGVQYLGYDYYRKGQLNPADNKWNYKRGRTPEEENMAMVDLKPTEKEPAQTAAKAWENITYFLKAVIPVAEQAGVKMALHPNDPPPPMSRGSEQIMSTFKDWKHLFDIVDSPANGMTFDCGVSTEIGENAVEVARYMLSRNRINHVHYRNVLVTTPRIKYLEVMIDNGDVDMMAVMYELVKGKYKYGIWAEHPRDNEFDTTHHSGGFVSYLYNQSYARAMMQACFALQSGWKP
ncbi:MAG TPA: mannonate dehydratase [Mucilaginibacter sp.]